jgi:hypothetical protein
MGFLFSRPTKTPQPTLQLTQTTATPLLFHSDYIGQPLATVLNALRARGIDNITVGVKPRDPTPTPAPRKATGRVIVYYCADTLLVHQVHYE